MQADSQRENRKNYEEHVRLVTPMPPARDCGIESKRPEARGEIAAFVHAAGVRERGGARSKTRNKLWQDKKQTLGATFMSHLVFASSKRESPDKQGLEWSPPLRCFPAHPVSHRIV